MRFKRIVALVFLQLFSCCRTMCFVRSFFSRCALFLTKRRNLSILFAIILLQLVLFQLAYYIYSKSSQPELTVMQAQLDLKLFQPVRKESDYVLVGNRSQQQQQQQSHLLHSPSRYFCGLPVPKGVEGPDNLQDDIEFLGAIVLLKGGVSPYWSKHPGFNWTIDGSPESLLDFAVFSSVVCTGKLLGFTKDNKLGRFFTFLRKLQMLQEVEEPLHRRKAAKRGFSAPFFWLKSISNPRFCVPNALLPSCTCPRASLAYSIVQRHRSYLMASLRDEVTRMQSQLYHNSGKTAQLLLRGLSNATHPDWPHEALVLLTASLCNRSFPVPEMAAAVDAVPTICETVNASRKDGVCIPQDVVYRLWRTVGHVNDQLQLSETAKQLGPWLYIFSGQFDSVRLLLRTLDLPSSEPALTVGRFVLEVYSNRAKQPASSALRFLVDGEDATESVHFCKPLIDYGGQRLCAADKFISFLQSEGDAGFWRLKPPVKVKHQKPEDKSLNIFERICQRTSLEELLPSEMVV